jgi:hypothetical protein
MKPITLFFALLVAMTITSCVQNKSPSEYEKVAINFEQVDYIEINNNIAEDHALLQYSKRFNEQQANEFVNKWNESKAVGMLKSSAKLFVKVHFKDGSSRSFRASGKFFKENNDFAFEFSDIKFLDTYWNELDIENINKIKYIFDEYLLYQESVESPKTKELMMHSLKSLNSITNAGDLELLINLWMYYDPTDFPIRDLVFNVLKKNKAISKKAIEKRIKNKKEWEDTTTAPFSDLIFLLKELE